MKGLFIFDMEANGLLEELTHFHCVLFKEYEKENYHLFLNKEHEEFESALAYAEDRASVVGTVLSVYDFTELNSWMATVPKSLACHNMFGYDLRAMKMLYNTEYDMFRDPKCMGTINGKQVNLFDTLSMSRTLFPDRPLPRGCPDQMKNPVTGKMKKMGPHGLEAWGMRVANLKPSIEDWRGLPLWKYVDRVWEDVTINELVWTALIAETRSDNTPEDKRFYYDDQPDPKRMKLINWKNALRRGMLTDYLMVEQEIQGVVFDIEKALKLRDVIDALMKDIEDEVEPQLPQKEMTESAKPNFPASPFKADGTISGNGWKWLERLGYKVDWDALNFKGPPAKAFKADGSLSASGIKYCNDHGIEDESAMPNFIRNQNKRSGTLSPLPADQMANAIQDLRDKKEPDFLIPMRLGNQDDIKKYLIRDAGWRPTLWRTNDVTKDQFKKMRPDSDVDALVKMYIQKLGGSEYRDLILKSVGFPLSKFQNPDLAYKFFRKKARQLPSSPKLKDERGALCPNLEEIDGALAKLIVKWLSSRNRRSVLDPLKEDKVDTGWLNHPRLKIDGKLPARFSGITNTGRRKHTIVANVPKPDPKVLFGYEMRELFTVPPDHYQVGIDGSNLEGMIAAWGAYEFDGGEYLRIMESGDAHCYSGDTEVLTARGWVRFDEAQPDEEVYQYNNETGSMELVKPDDFVKARYRGEMHHFVSKGVDILVTDKHRMVTFDDRDGGMRIDLAKDLNLRNGSRRFKTAALLDGKITLSAQELALVVAIQADGHLSKGRVRLEVAKGRKKDRALWALNTLGIQFSEGGGKTTSGGLESLRLSFDIPDWARKFVDEEKNFTKELINLSQPCKVGFVEELAEWGGWTSKGNILYSQATPRWESVSVVQTVASLCGFNTYVADIVVEGKDTQRRVTIRKGGKSSFGLLSVRKEVKSEDMTVYCYMVPSGVLLVRRNNKIVLCGNTRNAEAYSKASGVTVTRNGGKGITYG